MSFKYRNDHMNGPLKPATVIFLYQNSGSLESRPELASFRRYLGPLLSNGSFGGDYLETLSVLIAKEETWLVPMGLGDPDAIDEIKLIDASAAAVTQLGRVGAREAFIALPPVPGYSWPKILELMVIGARLASEKPKSYKTDPSAREPFKTRSLTFQYLGSKDPIEKPQVILNRADILAQAQLEARLFADMPPNALFPESFAEEAKRVALKHKLKITVWEEDKLVMEGAGGVAAVGQGSAHPPAIAVIEYPGRVVGAPTDTVALVGKGVTFDSGGICLKPAENMAAMKTDMSGAAAVLFAMEAAAEIHLPQKIVAVLPMAENMTGSKAYRPGDIIKTLSGQTVEIVNTDAEGRLLLADALTLAQKFKPNVIIDVATLTGACVVALGERIAGLFCDDEPLREALLNAGAEVGERYWPLPLHDPYDQNLKSDLADIKQAGGRPAGAINAALFLRRFVKIPVAWAHLDIAGTARASHKTPSCPEGATGFATRTILKYLINASANS
ncbi:MAG: leucyl aminopeptidase [Deltaproteobacteria bacterium]|jgi:leucyl aminopeptidase|nr:leucyl aminopeptidase [Deltaproteobacteria bacterium]